MFHKVEFFMSRFKNKQNIMVSTFLDGGARQSSCWMLDTNSTNATWVEGPVGRGKL